MTESLFFCGKSGHVIVHDDDGSEINVCTVLIVIKMRKPTYSPSLHNFVTSAICFACLIPSVVFTFDRYSTR